MTGLAFSDSLSIVEPLPKPRTAGITEVRNPALGWNTIHELTETLGAYIDTLKWTCGMQRLFSPDFVGEVNQYLKDNAIGVSTGGLLERVVLNGPEAVRSFLDESARLGFTIVEVSSGVTIMPLDSKKRLIQTVLDSGLTPKPEVAVTYGGGDASAKTNADFLLREVEACLDAGAHMVTIEEEGIFQFVDEIETGLVHRLVRAVGLEHLMFEAGDWRSITWLLSTYGPEVNLFFGHDKLPYVASFRAGIWGPTSTWGRMAVHR